MAHNLRTYRRVLVQTASRWPDADDDWTTREEIEAPEGSQGWSLEMGAATIQQRFGYGKTPGGTSLATTDHVDGLPGGYVRLLLRDDAGSVSITLADDEDATTWRPFWWGIVLDLDRGINNASDTRINGLAKWTVAGLLYDLDVHPYRGHEAGKTTGGVDGYADPGESLGFNLCGTALGDRSANAFDIGSGESVYIHDRANPGTPWTAAQAVNYLLAVRNTEDGPNWKLSGQTDALSFSEKWELKGLTIMSRIARILAPRRGLGFRVVVRGAIPYLVVTTTTDVDVSVDNFTLPANEEQVSLIVAGKHHIHVEKIKEDHSAVLDEIGVEAKRPWRCLTFKYPDDLDKGWTAAEETAWDAATSVQREAESLNHVHRRYILKATPRVLWVCNKRVLGTDDSYGTAGETGEQTFDNTLALAPQTLELTRKLPLYAGYDYTDAIPADPDKTRPLQDPRLFFDDGGTYVDYSDMFNLTVDDDATAVIIGSGGEHGERIKNLLVTYGGSLWVTVGVLDPLPLRVLWRRDPADWPRSSPRRRLYPMHEAQLWTLDSGTILKAGSSTATGGTVRDDRPRMREVLALARSWFSAPSYDLQWTDHSVIDVVDGFHPGAMVTSVQFGDRSIGLYGVISSRDWNFSEGGCFTRYTTKRVLPDLRGVL
jgi:hypothetical protein